MTARNTGNGAEPVYAAAHKWVNCALRSDDSLFTPGKPIWTQKLLGVLHDQVLNRPDVGDGDFWGKLQQQLAGSPPEAYQLMGEVLYLHYLPLYINPATKEASVNRVLGWSPNPAAIPAEICAGFQQGFVALGAGKALIRYQVGTLIETVEQWKALPAGEKERLTQDPWECKAFLDDLRFHSRLLESNPNKGRGVHHLLLHSIFPDTFEPMLGKFKRQIIEAKAFDRFLTERNKDHDRTIQQIRQGIAAELGKDFSFHADYITPYWNPKPGEPVVEKFEPGRSWE